MRPSAASPSCSRSCSGFVRCSRSIGIDDSKSRRPSPIRSRTPSSNAASQPLGMINERTSFEEIYGAPREEKDATNAVIVLMANHAVMTFHRNLAFDIVASFYRGYLPLIEPGLRRMMTLVEQAYIHHEDSAIEEETGLGTYHWVHWLLDRMKDVKDPREEHPHRTQTDWRP